MGSRPPPPATVRGGLTRHAVAFQQVQVRRMSAPLVPLEETLHLRLACRSPSSRDQPPAGSAAGPDSPMAARG